MKKVVIPLGVWIGLRSTSVDDQLLIQRRVVSRPPAVAALETTLLLIWLCLTLFVIPRYRAVMTALNLRLAVALLVWLAIEGSRLDDRLVTQSGISLSPLTLDVTEAIGLLVWAFYEPVLKGSWLRSSAALTYRIQKSSGFTHIPMLFSQEQKPERKPRGDSKDPKVEALLQALRETTTASRRDNHRRDQLIVALHEAGLSFREIASHTDVSYSTVRDIIARTESEEIQLRQTDEWTEWREWEAAGLEDVLTHIRSHVQPGPVSREEYEALKVEADVDESEHTDQPPGAEWRHQPGLLVIERYFRGSPTLTVLEAARPYRDCVLVGLRRMRRDGYDRPAELRQKWLDFLGRMVLDLAAEQQTHYEAPDSLMNWYRASPARVIAYIEDNYPDPPLVTDQEIRELIDGLATLSQPDLRVAPMWQWSVVDVRGLLNRALSSRQDLRPEDYAGQYRIGKLAEQYRLQRYGVDVFAEYRSSCLAALASLTVEALRSSPSRQQTQS